MRGLVRIRSSSGQDDETLLQRTLPTTRNQDEIFVDKALEEQELNLGKSFGMNHRRRVLLKRGALLCFLGCMAFTLAVLQPMLSALALAGAELYRAALDWHNLSTGVYRAFVLDQTVMKRSILLREEGWEKKRWHGQGDINDRGILIPAGGKQQMANAFVNLYVLRHHLGCKLPVTIAFWGESPREVPSARLRHYFEAKIPDVQFLDLAESEYPVHHRLLSPPDPLMSFNGFKVKVFALYAAPYRQVLLMDSDSMALADPTPLFDHEEFKKHGNVFWPDRWCRPVKLFSLLGMDAGQEEQGAQTDSGQFLFDRYKHSKVLDWLLFLNTHDEFTYRYAHGDKDTYKAAFYLASKMNSFYQVPQPLSVGLEPAFGFVFSQRVVPRGFIQHHPDDGSAAFVHRTSKAKYATNSGTKSDRRFSHILLQPSCSWNQRFWHFFTPMIGSVYSNSTDVTIIEASTFIQEAQHVADSAHGMIMEDAML
eukprot:jgi/Picsp_1/1451/NSC_04930-R1_hypothetical protein CHLNCDRAFT_139528 [Chlorella variabilis]